MLDPATSGRVRRRIGSDDLQQRQSTKPAGLLQTLVPRPARGAAFLTPDPSASPPLDFDPTQLPILARHYFGVAPVADPNVLRDLRFRRDVARLHKLGPRPLYELLAEIGRQHQCRAKVYGALDPATVAQLGGDRFPPAIFAVSST